MTMKVRNAIAIIQVVLALLVAVAQWDGVDAFKSVKLAVVASTSRTSSTSGTCSSFGLKLNLKCSSLPRFLLPVTRGRVAGSSSSESVRSTSAIQMSDRDSDPAPAAVATTVAAAAASGSAQSGSESEASVASLKLAMISSRESTLKESGCSEGFLEYLGDELFYCSNGKSSTDEILVGLRGAIPDHWVALMGHISEVNSSLQIQLKENATDPQLWSSMLSTHADPDLAEHIKRYRGNQSNALARERSPLEQLVETLHRLWGIPKSATATALCYDEMAIPLQLQIIRELVDYGLVVAQFQRVKQSNLNTDAMKFCLFLANNDAILRLSEESWTKIYSFSKSQYFDLNYNLAAQVSSRDHIEVVLLVRSYLKQHGIPLRADQATTVVAVSSDVVSAFQANYSDPWKNRDRFIDHMYECMELHYSNISVYKSPYTAIIQSSGTGKSKLLSEVGKQVPVIYVSLLRRESSGFPQLTHALAPNFKWSVANKLVNADRPALCLCGIFIAGIRCFAAHNYDPEAFFRAQDISNPIGSIGSWFETYRVPNIDSMTLSSAVTLLVDEAGNLTANMSAHAAISRHRGTQRQPCFVLVVDEARELLDLIEILHSSNSPTLDFDKTTSSFRLFRNALQKLAVAAQDTNLQLFAVLTDTSSRIGNFIPSAIEDPSSRATPQVPKKLHRPFWLVQNSNVFYKTRVLADAHARSKQAAKPISALSGIELLDVHFTKACMYRIGRPLWQSLDYLDCDHAVDFAMSKLLGGVTPFDFDKHKPSLAQKMAALNVRLPMSLHAYGALSANLPAQHMRLITGISEDRALVFGEYGPEPVLAAASEKLMCTYNAYSPVKLLQTLRSQISLGMVDSGDIGERTVALTYLIARDLARKRSSKLQTDKESFPLITVEQLLQELHNNSVSLLRNNLLIETPNKRKGNKTSNTTGAGSGTANATAAVHMPQGDLKYEVATTTTFTLESQSMSMQSLCDVESKQERSITEIEADSSTKDDTPLSPPPPTMVYKSKSDLNELLRGTVSFNQFVEVSYTPSVSDLLCAYLLGVGIMCRRNQAGVDLIIPVMLPVRPGSFEPESESASEFQGPPRPLSRSQAPNDLTFNATEQRGVFDSSSSVVFADLSVEDRGKRDMHFGDIKSMEEMWNSLTSIASKLLGDLSDEERWSMTDRMSAILVQVKNSPDNASADDANTTPERSVIRDVCGTWSDPKWQKAYIAIKHVLLSNTANLDVMRTPSLFQHGLVVKGLDEAKQPCMKEGVAAAMLQVVDTFINHCIAAGKNIDNRFISATMIDMKHKLSNNGDPFMALEGSGPDQA